jgi:demethylmenaquinone methyltransferase/2-methoxy-6-polyprenyl-1,4-benzoquinol methylase
VLKPGTRLCILEFGTGSKRVWKGLYNFYLDTLLPFIGDRISGDPGAYRYLAETIKSFPDERALGNELLSAGFERVYNVPMMSGIVYLHVAEKPMTQPKASPASGAPKKATPKTKAAPKKSVSKKKAASKKGTTKK